MSFAYTPPYQPPPPPPTSYNSNLHYVRNSSGGWDRVRNTVPNTNPMPWMGESAPGGPLPPTGPSRPLPTGGYPSNGPATTTFGAYSPLPSYNIQDILRNLRLNSGRISASGRDHSLAPSDWKTGVLAQSIISNAANSTSAGRGASGGGGGGRSSASASSGGLGFNWGDIKMPSAPTLHNYTQQAPQASTAAYNALLGYANGNGTNVGYVDASKDPNVSARMDQAVGNILAAGNTAARDAAIASGQGTGSAAGAARSGVYELLASIKGNAAAQDILAQENAVRTANEQQNANRKLGALQASTEAEHALNTDRLSGYNANVATHFQNQGLSMQSYQAALDAVKTMSGVLGQQAAASAAARSGGGGGGGNSGLAAAMDLYKTKLNAGLQQQQLALEKQRLAGDLSNSDFDRALKTLQLQYQHDQANAGNALDWAKLGAEQANQQGTLGLNWAQFLANNGIQQSELKLRQQLQSHQISQDEYENTLKSLQLQAQIDQSHRGTYRIQVNPDGTQTVVYEGGYDPGGNVTLPTINGGGGITMNYRPGGAANSQTQIAQSIKALTDRISGLSANNSNSAIGNGTQNEIDTNKVRLAILQALDSAPKKGGPWNDLRSKVYQLATTGDVSNFGPGRTQALQLLSTLGVTNGIKEYLPAFSGSVVNGRWQDTGEYNDQVAAAKAQQDRQNGNNRILDAYQQGLNDARRGGRR